ncbi:MAG: hypothetical protein QOH21_2679 [Acidobacteriota bacterium]|jgi:hypothetical protein|nr:hypothetical protein [Acidobacteriota bacterium]
MITKADWQAVNHELMAEQRRAFGEPPPTEQLLAYTRGELPAEAEERVRDLLVCHPDFARAVAVPFPREAAMPGEADFLSETELANEWAQLQRRLHRPRSRTGGGVLQFPHALTALAAAIALVFAGLYWQAQSQLHRLDAPRLVVDEQLLQPDERTRGGQPAVTLTARGDSFLLIVKVAPEATQLAIVERTAAGERPLWSSEAVPRNDGTFAVIVPRRFVAPGEYQLVVSAGAERLATYSVRVEGE